MRALFAYELCLSVVLVCFALSTLAAPGAQQARAEALHVPLRRPAPVTKTTDEWEIWVQKEKLKLETKYGSSSARRRTSGYNLLVNQNQDESYYGSIAVGTPAVAYDVLLDTGSADLWLASSNCLSGCPSGVTTFDTSSSSTFSNLTKAFSITYGSGAASGYLVSDDIQMASFQVSEQTFGLVNTMTSGLIDAPVSGLMGLAWQGLSSSNAMPFWQQLYESNVLSEPVMGFFLTRFLNATHATTLETGGTFTLGALNSSLYTGSVDYQSLSQSNLYWTIALDNVTVGSSTISVSSGHTNAVIDTGTTLIGGPSTEVADIYAQIEGSQPLSGSYEGYYSYPCDANVQISLSFGGPSWSISSDDFKLVEIQQGTCIGSLFVYTSSSSTSPSQPFGSRASSSSAVSWIVGDTFLKNVYSVFRANPAAVGFAQLSDVALALNGDTSASVPTPTAGTVSASVTGTTSGASNVARPALSLLVVGAVLGGYFLW